MAPPAPAVRRMTAAEFASLPDTSGLDLGDGIVLEIEIGTVSSWIAGRLH